MKTKTIGAVLAFCLIFGGAFYLRQFTLWLQHWEGDQSQYVMLAMKLGDRLDFSQYNLRSIDVESLRPDDPPGTEIIYPYTVKGEGFVSKVYQKTGMGFYDMPFFYKGPMLPVVLQLSHRLFSGSDHPYAVVKSNLRDQVLHVRPPLLLKTQFWASVVPLTCSLLVLLLIFVWAFRVFGAEPAVVAALIFAANPVSILTSNRVWTEDLGLLLLTLSMFVYRKGFRANKAALCLASGILLGLAVLANQRNLLAAVALGIYTAVLLAAGQRTPGGFKVTWIKALTDLRWWSFLAAVAAMTAGWFWTIYRHYGSPFWQPEVFVRMHYGQEIRSLGSQANMQAWYDVLLAQPHGLIYYPVGTAAICWAFAAGYLTARDAWLAGRNAIAGRPFDERPVFLWCWIAVFAAYFMSNRTGEYRYLFPVYPALAALSGWMLIRLRDRIAGFTAHRFIATAVIIVFLAAAAAHSVRIIMPILWKQQNLISAPWR